MSEVSAGYAQHSLLIFPMIPSCQERVQRVKRNPNLNSAEVLCAACFQESGIIKNKTKIKFFPKESCKEKENLNLRFSAFLEKRGQ